MWSRSTNATKPFPQLEGAATMLEGNVPVHMSDEKEKDTSDLLVLCGRSEIQRGQSSTSLGILDARLRALDDRCASIDPTTTAS